MSGTDENRIIHGAVVPEHRESPELRGSLVRKFQNPKNFLHPNLETPRIKDSWMRSRINRFLTISDSRWHSRTYVLDGTSASSNHVLQDVVAHRAFDNLISYLIAKMHSEEKNEVLLPSLCRSHAVHSTFSLLFLDTFTLPFPAHLSFLLPSS